MAAQLTPSTLPQERGQIVVIAVVVLVISGVMGFSMIEHVVSAKDEGAAGAAREQGLLVAESALDMAIHDLEAGGSGALGSRTAPIRLGGATFYTETEELENGTITIHAAGLREGHRRVIRARVRRSAPVFHHAIFAGNSSKDSGYVMRFEGLGTDADDINGDIYSGGALVVAEDADVSGAARAQGMVDGIDGLTGLVQPGFDFSGVDFSATGIVDVAAQFASQGVLRSSAAGGTASELPETNPAHIFRLNPSDRVGETSGTSKPDYFLEDPYETVGGTSSADNGTDNYMVTVGDGLGGERQTYYIDGNLWIHSYKSYAFMLASGAGTGTQVTFIVRGNITFSDSFRIEDVDRDAVGFVALEDPNVPDSGNIYMGDPSFGTLKELHAYLYAENDFLDINLSAAGSKSVRLLGAMTAGDKVAIERTYQGGHSKLTVDWDQRLQTGAVSLPILDTSLPGVSSRVTLEAWVEAGGAPSDVAVPVTPATPGTVPLVPVVRLEEPLAVEHPWWTEEWLERKISYDEVSQFYSKEIYLEKLLAAEEAIEAAQLPDDDY